MPIQAKERSRTKASRSRQTVKPAISDPSSPESAGGRAATSKSTPVASTPADSVDDPVPARRPAKTSSRKKSLRTAGGPADPGSLEQSTDPKKLSPASIIRQMPGPFSIDQQELPNQLLPVTVSADSESPERGVAQLEELAIRNGDDAGSNPVPAIAELPEAAASGSSAGGLANVPPTRTSAAAAAGPQPPPIFGSAIALEKMVVGSAMRYPAQFRKLASIIRQPDVFHTYANQCVWRAIAKLDGDGKPVDVACVADTLLTMKLKDDVPTSYLIDLFESASSLSVDHHAELLLDRFIKRQMTGWAKHLLEDKLSDPAVSPLSLIQEAKIDLDRLAAIKCGGDDEDEGDKGRYISFPVDVLPTSLQDFVLAASDALGCDPAFVAIPSLVAVGAAIGTSQYVAIKDSWFEPAVFWAAIVADPSSLKSPALDAAIEPLRSIQKELSLDFDQSMSRWRFAAAEFHDTRYSRNKSAGNGQAAMPPDKPIPGKLLVNDITIERLAQVMWQNPHGVCLCRDELSGWFSSFSRYGESKGPGADLSQWLEIWRAKSIIVDRKGGDPPSFYIERAACSVVGTIQPRVLAKILGEANFDNGLASRLLLSMPPRKAKVWTEKVIPPDCYNTYNNIIKYLYLASNTIRDQYTTKQKQVNFSKSGKAAWIDFYTEWAENQTGAIGDRAHALAKLEAYCARFCLLIACYEKAGNEFRDDDITEGHVHRAAELVKWFAGEMDRVYSMVRKPAEKSVRDQLVEFIRANGGQITARRLMRANKSRYPKKEDAMRPMNSLVDQGIAEWVNIPAEDTGGAPMRALRLKETSIES